VRIALAGTPHVAIPTLDWLSTSEHDLVKVFTTSAKPSGRGGRLVSSDVALWCKERSIEYVEISQADDFDGHLKDIDCVIVIAFGLLLPQQILDQPRFGFINLHFSVLPRWRGAAPVQRAIENADTHLGITVFRLDAGMDTGPVFRSASFPRDPRMRAAEALDYLAVEGVSLIQETLQDITRDLAPMPQSLSGSSIASKITKDEAVINWGSSASEVHRRILAFFPNPIARTTFRGELIKVTQANLVSEPTEVLHPGELRASKSAVLVGTANGVVEISSVIPQGKSEMSASDWARGARINLGECFG
jgi:methionyl-tRNA formyltransferase